MQNAPTTAQLIYHGAGGIHTVQYLQTTSIGSSFDNLMTGIVTAQC